jgi:hypothetical protein
MQNLDANFELFNSLLIASNCEPISRNEAEDWGLNKDLSEAEIVQMSNDLISEIGSIRCENKNQY